MYQIGSKSVVSVLSCGMGYYSFCLFVVPYKQKLSSIVDLIYIYVMFVFFFAFFLLLCFILRVYFCTFHDTRRMARKKM